MKRKHAVGQLRWDGKVWRRWNGRRWSKALYSRNPSRLMYAAPLTDDEPLDASTRAGLLAQAVEDEVAHGSQVLFVGPRGTVMARKRGVFHLGHALLTLLTAGFWGIFWIVACLSRTEIRFRLEADDWGHVWALPPSK